MMEGLLSFRPVPRKDGHGVVGLFLAGVEAKYPLDARHRENLAVHAIEHVRRAIFWRRGYSLNRHCRRRRLLKAGEVQHTVRNHELIRREDLHETLVLIKARLSCRHAASARLSPGPTSVSLPFRHFSFGHWDW